MKQFPFLGRHYAIIFLQFISSWGHSQTMVTLWDVSGRKIVYIYIVKINQGRGRTKKGQKYVNVVCVRLGPYAYF